MTTVTESRPPRQRYFTTVMSSFPLVRRLAALTALAAVYFVAGKLGLRLAFVHPSATPVWPPAGIALAAFLILGYRVWPAIFVGAFLVNLTTAGSLATSLGIGLGNTLEGLLGAYLVDRFAGGRRFLWRARDVFKFALLAAIISTTVSATFGVTSLAVGGFAPWANYRSIWLTWWLGDAVGDLVVAPVVIAWIARPRLPWRSSRVAEAVLLFASLTLAGQVIFGGLPQLGARNYPLEFFAIPLLLWATFRFGPREAATAVLLLSGIATWGTLRGFGPFVQKTPNESLLLLQAYMGVTALTTLTLAAVVAERREVERQLRHLSVSDPLTGLANYRQLIDRIQTEVQRSRRTQRPFALVFLDVDHLKKINDRHGHLVGSRALCRVAEVLRDASRVMDTAARYGGDEFALLLPEADRTAALQVGHRVTELLARDGETPPVTVSFGVAVYPSDAETAEALLGTADRALYGMKARGRENRLSDALAQQGDAGSA